MKKLFAVIIGAFFLSLVQSAPSQALPDGRLSLSVNTTAVFMGTEATLTPSQNISEAASYNWNYVKYEIYAVGSSSYVGKASLTQLNAGTCAGILSYSTSTTRSCVTSFNGNRTVLSAATTSSTIAGVALKLTSLGETSKVFKVRIWLDRNNDDRINPYEPASSVSTFHVFDPKTAAPFVDFGIDPPVLSTNEFTAWVGAGTIPGTGASAIGLMDPSLLSVEMTHCAVESCTTRRVIGSWVAHPQLLRYEFTSSTGFTAGLKYFARLVYKESDKESVVIANQNLDFSKTAPVSVNTSVKVNGQNVIASDKAVPDSPKRQRTTLASTTTSSITYHLEVLDSKDKPLAGQIVYLALDIKDVMNATSVYIDNVQLTSRDRDVVFVKRATNALGQVSAEISVRSMQAGDRIEIDSILNGLRAYEFPGSGSQEVVIWNYDDVRNVQLILPSTSAMGGAGFTITARVTSGAGIPVTTDRVIFSTDGPLTIANPTSLLTASGTATATVNWSHLALGTGSQTLVAYVISESGISSTSAPLYWRSEGAVIQSTPTSTVAEAGGVSIDFEGTPFAGKAGTSILVQGLLKDQSGRPIVTSALPEGFTFGITYSGPGYVSGNLPTVTDVNGKFSFKVILGASESGIGQVQVKFDKDGSTGGYPEFLGTHYIEVAKVIPSISALTTKNVLSLTVTNALYRAAEIYLDGKLQQKRVITASIQKIAIKSKSGAAMVRVMLNGKVYFQKKLVIP